MQLLGSQNDMATIRLGVQWRVAGKMLWIFLRGGKADVTDLVSLAADGKDRPPSIEEGGPNDVGKQTSAPERLTRHGFQLRGVQL